MEDVIQDLVRQKIQEVLQACGIDRYGTEIVTHEVAAISRVGLSLLIQHAVCCTNPALFVKYGLN